MAPPSKKAKLGPPTANGGLSRFFGQAKPAEESKVTDGQKQPDPPPAAQPEKADPAPASKPEQAASLTDEQKKRVEENRQKAQEKKRAREAAKAAESAAPAEAAPVPEKAAPVEAAPAPKKAAAKKTAQPKRAAGASKTPTKADIPSSKGNEATPEKPTQPNQGRRIATACSGRAEPLVTCKFEGLESKWMQYNNLYKQRLSALSGAAREVAKARWSQVVPEQGFLQDLSGYKTSEISEVVIVGVTFKDLKDRPNVIDEYKGIKALGVVDKDENMALARLYSEKDTLWLEDHIMRIQLDMSEDQVASFATGLVLAVRGRATEAGTFKVTDTCLPRMTAAMAPALPVRSDDSQAPFLALLSGLAFGSTSEALAKARKSAIDFLTEKIEVSLQQVVICGGTFAKTAMDKARLKEALLEVNEELSRLVAVRTVQMMAGRGEPTNSGLPQLPFHRQLFRQLRTSSFRPAGNPCSFKLENLDILGHSGQPVEDLMRCARLASPLNALELCLEARHLAPTAPDTLPTQPFEGSDPFIMDSAPHILFSGGHSEVANSWQSLGESGTQCICVPAFHLKPAVVLVNLRDPRDVRVQEFGSLEDA